MITQPSPASRKGGTANFEGRESRKEEAQTMFLFAHI